jgi:hypothetical protein
MLMAERVRCTDASREAEWVRRVVEYEVCDMFRVAAFYRRNMVPDDEGYAGLSWMEEMDVLEGVQEHANILRMAAAHPDFPREVGALLGPACEEFDAWLAALPAVLAPVHAIEEAVDAGAAPPEMMEPAGV